MIGKICISIFSYYDANLGKNQFKKRPALIIGKADEGDYVVLPISTIKKKEYIDEKFDIKLSPEEFDNLTIRDVSYVRTHKQTIINENDIHHTTDDLKREYPEKFLEIISKVESFQNTMINDAIKMLK